MVALTTGKLAEVIGAVCEGDRDVVLTGAATLEDASEGCVSFYAGARWKHDLKGSEASAIICGDGEMPNGVVLLRHSKPRLAFAKALRVLYPEEWPVPGTHPLSSVASSATVSGATIEAFAVVEEGAIVHSGSWIQAHAYVGRGAIIGSGARLMPHAVVLERVEVGDNVILQPGVVIGGNGFGYVTTNDGLEPVPQVGSVVISSNVEIGANSTIDRASVGTTTLGPGSKLDNHVHIAHGVVTGSDCLFAAYAAVSGGSKIGDRVVMAGRSAITEHVTVGDDALLLGMTATSKGVAAKEKVGGSPARPAMQWAREQASLKQLPNLLTEIKTLKSRISALEELLSEDPK